MNARLLDRVVSGRRTLVATVLAVMRAKDDDRSERILKASVYIQYTYSTAVDSQGGFPSPL